MEEASSAHSAKSKIMKIQCTKTALSKNASEILLEAGYHFFVDPNTQKSSYVMRIGRQYYPRYHVYISEGDNTVTIDLHIDQKQVSYEGQNMHSGEYDSPVVQEEMGRIQRWIDFYTQK